MTPRRTAFALAAIAALLSTILVAPTQAAPAPGKAGADQSSAEAKAALSRVRAIFNGTVRGGRGQESAGAPTDPAAYDATLALKELALVKDQLTGADRKAADAFFTRPSQPPGPGNPDSDYSYGATPDIVTCSGPVCVHYVTTGRHATTPAYANLTLNTMVDVHNTFVAAGYRPPLPDGGRDGGNQTDIYIADIGDDGLYGYCATDDQSFPPFTTWAYCVLDEDYAASEFPTNTPVENLRVTAAHEYYHAVQFGYDIAEDSWFMEATAAWVEDEVYDGVNDNVNYLPRSPLTMPEVPLDTFASTFHYGTWIFFRYISERYRASQGGLPTIVRDMWRRVDDAPGAPDLYSIQAVSRVLAAKNQNFARFFAKFSSANRRPDATYSESRANNYPKAPLMKRYVLGKRDRRSGSVRLDHLTSGTFRARPGAALRSDFWKLRVTLDMAPRNQGSAAVAAIRMRSGATRVVTFAVGPRGGASKVLPFNARKVAHVEVTLANAGIAYRCFNQGDYSCQGTSRRDNVREAWRLQVVGSRLGS